LSGWTGAPPRPGPPPDEAEPYVLPRPDEPGSRSRRALDRKHRRRKTLIILGTVFGTIAALVIAVGGYWYYKLNGNITSVDPDQNGPRPAAAAGNAENILLMGSDTRSGKNGAVVGGGLQDSSGFGHSDTEMILHISADHKHALVMSLPRDLVIDLPNCKNAQGHTVPGHLGQINAAYALGGPLCAEKTVETLTGIRMDHLIVIDFQGFVNLVNDIDGVQVCVPKAVDDPKSNIHFKAGKITVKGQASLDYVREREKLGDGGDRSRITRQHAFLSSMISKMESSGILLNPVKLLSLANDATKAITVDKGLNTVSKLLGFANSIKGIKPADIRFFTVKTQNYAPTMPSYQTYKYQLALVPSVAKAEFAALRNDTSMDSATASPTPAASTPGTTPPVSGRGIRVAVYNGTQRKGLASRTAAKLRKSGFTATVVKTALGGAHPTTLVEYGPGQKAKAATLAKLFPGAKLKAQHPAGIRLIVGADQAAATTPAKTPVAPAPIASARSATSDICQGLQSGDE
jgi:LCP family protein required for cell wall assembly